MPSTEASEAAGEPGACLLLPSARSNSCRRLLPPSRPEALALRRLVCLQWHRLFSPCRTGRSRPRASGASSGRRSTRTRSTSRRTRSRLSGAQTRRRRRSRSATRARRPSLLRPRSLRDRSGRRRSRRGPRPVNLSRSGAQPACGTRSRRRRPLVTTATTRHRRLAGARPACLSGRRLRHGRATPALSSPLVGEGAPA